MKKVLIWIAVSLAYIGLLMFIGLMVYNKGYDRGYAVGAEDSFDKTMDTIQSIINNQMLSDTSVTELLLINPDTTTFYLSRKTVLSHE